MAFHDRGRGKHLRLTIFDNEPMARLAEQRLRKAGVPCYTRSLGVGPGAWGSAYNLPHGLYVYQGDVTRAREVLDLAPPEPTGYQTARPVRRRIALGLAAAGIIVAWLVAGAVAFLVARLAG